MSRSEPGERRWADCPWPPRCSSTRRQPKSRSRCTEWSRRGKIRDTTWQPGASSSDRCGRAAGLWENWISISRRHRTYERMQVTHRSRRAWCTRQSSGSDGSWTTDSCPRDCSRLFRGWSKRQSARWRRGGELMRTPPRRCTRTMSRTARLPWRRHRIVWKGLEQLIIQLLSRMIWRHFKEWKSSLKASWKLMFGRHFATLIFRSSNLNNFTATSLSALKYLHPNTAVTM